MREMWYLMTWNWHMWRMRRSVRALSTHARILMKVFPEANPMKSLADRLENTAGVSIEEDER